MTTSPLIPDHDDDNDHDKNRKDLKTKKETRLEPIGKDSHANEVNERQIPAPDIPGASDDLLDELRKKTAKLASKVGGTTHPKERTLNITDEKSPKQIFDELDVAVNAPTHRSQPENSDKKDNDSADEKNPVVSLVRDKLSKIYEKEPDTTEEAIESYQAGRSRSIHQQFMYDLTTSGKSLAEIQTAWHNYYVDLQDHEKHEVWKEFYDNQRRTSKYAAAQMQSVQSNSKPTNHQQEPTPRKPSVKPRTDKVGDVKSKIYDKVSAGGKLKAIHHVKSLMFGVGLAALVGLIVTFTFFNEVFLAPFISPSHSVSATPILGSQTGEVGPEPKIIIPKINLEVPVVFDLNSIQEKDIQNALEDGVVHYSTTPNPGEKGNTVIVGHSSNNILNSGKYKFAFVLLKRLEIEDTFFVHRDGVRYTYKVYKRDVVKPDDTSVLKTQDRASTITLITCDPPGTSINRLIITAEQISPDPIKNSVSTAPILENVETDKLPSNAPSLWSRIWPF